MLAEANIHAHSQRSQSTSYLQAHQGDVHRVGGGQRGEQPPLVRQVLKDVFAAELGPLRRVPHRNGDADLARVDSALCYEHATCADNALPQFEDRCEAHELRQNRGTGE